MFLSLSTLLQALAASAASIPFVAAQDPPTLVTTEQLYGNLVSTVAPAPGFNPEGGSVFTNYVNAVNNKQFFLIRAASAVYEKPGSEPAQFTIFIWCSDLTFSDFRNSSLMGFAGRCATKVLAGYAELMAAGGQATDVVLEGEFGSTRGISAVFVEQLNVFEGQLHSNTDDWVVRYWDSGLKTAPWIAWEGHDEGDMASNAATSSVSTFGEITWMTAAELAQFFNTSVDTFSPEKFKQVYEEAWIKEHESQAKIQTDTAEAELEIVEEVENEKEGAENSPIDDSGSRRKLVEATARFVSATLRVFGI